MLVNRVVKERSHASVARARDSWMQLPSRCSAILVTAAMVVVDPGSVGGIVKSGPSSCNPHRSGSAFDPGGIGGVPGATSAATKFRVGRGSDGVGGIPISRGPTTLGAGGVPCIAQVGSVGVIPGLKLGNPDGAGGIPCSSSQSHSVHLMIGNATTVGLLVDPTIAPIAQTQILILCADGSVVAATTTDQAGAFEVSVPKLSGLTLSLPTLNVFDVPVSPGSPLLLVVP